MKKIFYITAFSVIAVSHLQAILITGDPSAAAGETFSFDLGFAAFDAGTEYSAPRLWMANNDADMSTKSDTVKPYGLSFVNQVISYVPAEIVIQATPMANQENATIYTYNGTTAFVTGAANPIWGGTFHLFEVPIQKPMFVTTSALNKIYSVVDIKRYENPTDDQQNVTQLIEHDFGVGEQTHAISGYGNDVIFAAHAAGAFGSTASKISELYLSSYAAENGTSIPYFKTIADTIISTSTDALKGGVSGNNLAALGSSVTTTYTLNNLFIGVDTTANALAGSCATALTFATLNSDANAFIFNEIAPAAILTTGIDTVVSAAASGEVRITKIAGMSTTTGLSYLIVARDNGTGPQTIYALPIITTGVDTGKIADFTEITNIFIQKSGIFNTRQFTTEISSITQIDPTGIFASQLLVGGDLPLNAPNSIKKLYVVGDSVYVVIGDEYDTGQTPGTFRSQPIYAQDGHIVAWTAWSHVLGSDQQMNYSFVDRKTLSGYYIAHVTTNFRAVNQTTFSASSFMQPLFDLTTTGGIQGLFNFPASTPGFNNELSVLMSTGYGLVALGQTGILNSGNVAINNPVTTLSFSEANVNNQTSIIAAEFAHDTNNDYHWLFVGGASGVSVLTCDSPGYSWSGSLNNISCLNIGQNFKTVGDFKFVKKLVWDTTYIYILTSTELYRIALDPNKFTANPTEPLNPELVLSSSALSKNPSYFLDLIIDNGFCLIGSTAGLFSFDTTHQGLLNITTPSGLPAASQLIAYSSASQPQRNFKTLSNLLVLNNSFGSQQARINRFTITNGVIVPFDDFLIAEPGSTTQGIPSSFIKFDNYINNYFSDGSWNIASSYYQGLNQPTETPGTPYVLQIFTGIRSGFSSSQIILPMFSGYAPLVYTNALNPGFIFGPNLAGFIRESTSGSVMAYGTFLTHANV
ncbi:hypothetical protein KBB68_01285 [Candidatus Babeliales bacterium]|nr:hypothetical protein [Candidatus Babeliales bacterium]